MKGGTMRWLKALAAVLVIVAITAGVPWALITFVGNPWPAGGVDLMSPLTDEAIIGVLAAIAWVLWAQLMICLVVEAAAAIGNRDVDVRIPGAFGFQQQLARVLITSVVLAIGSSTMVNLQTATAATPADPVPTNTVSAPVQAPVQSAPEQAQQDLQAADTTITVQAGDTLWRLAEKHLGDGMKFTEIAQLNEGQTMADGRVFRSSESIHPGWDLKLPADRNTATTAGETPYTVKAGDTLSQIAQDQLGDATLYPKIFDASKTIEQPSGAHLADPDHIEPGWKLKVTEPDAAATIPAPAPAPHAAAPAPQDLEPNTSAETPAKQPATGAEAPVAIPKAPEAAPEISIGGADELDDQEDTAADVDEEDQKVPFRTLGGIGTLLAGSVIGLLAMRRRRQQSRREPGESIALPEPAAQHLEIELRSVAGLDAPLTIDNMLRALAGAFAATGHPLPSIKFARWSDQQLELYLTEDADLPAPWMQISGPQAWSSPAQIPVDADLSLPAPYPTLVTIGHDEEGGTVLVNLEHTTPLSINAIGEVDHQVIAAAAIELGTAPWATDVTVVLVGGWSELVHVLEPGRARYVPSLEDYTASAGIDVVLLADGPAVDAPALLAASEHAAAVVYPGDTARWNIAVDGDAGLLQPIGLPLQVQTLSANDYALIAEALGTAQVTTAPAVAPTVVDDHQVDAPTVDSAEIEDEDVDEGRTGDLDLAQVHHLAPSPPAAGTVVLDEPAHVLVDQSIEDLEGVSPTATLDEQAEPVASTSTVTMSDRLAARDSILQTGHPVLRLLGPQAELVGSEGAEPTHTGTCLRIATFLMLNRNTTKTQLVETLWPATRNTGTTVNPRISQLRKWLGADESGELYLPLRSLKIDQRVMTDWDIFTSLVGDSVATASSPNLEKAIALVESRPLAGHPAREYPFVEFAAQEMIATIVDAVYELARRRYMEGRWRDVETLAALGVSFEPGTERLWRIWIRAAHSAGNPPAVEEAIERMHVRIEEVGYDLAPKTRALIAAYESGDIDNLDRTMEGL